MGNGQSSPAGSHPLPPAAKVQTSHREHHRRSPSPGGQARTLPPARKKSLELPDLARLNFTSATSPSTTAAVAAGADRSPAKQAAAAANEATTNGTPGKAGSRGMLGRKRASPLAPAIMTSPLSPISPKQTPAHAQSSSHNPYFPPTATAAAGGFGSSQVSAEASPIDIPHTPSQAPPPALPAYDRVAYTPEPPSRRTSEAQPAPQPTTTTLLPATRKTTAGPAAGPGKKARIADEPPSFLPAAPTTAPAAVAAPTAAPSTSPTLSPAAKTHKPKQPSVTGADEDNTIRSSLPSGGDEYPPGQDPASQPQPPPQPQQPQPQQHQQPPSSSAVAGAAAAGGGALGLSLSQDQPPPQKAPAPARPREELVSVEAEEGVPTIINWTGGGKEVYVCGTFAKNWKERLKMSKRCVASSRASIRPAEAPTHAPFALLDSTHDFTLVLNLPPGPHRLKFIVDETWRCSDDLANATDADGSLVNYIEVEPTRKDGDGPGWSSEWDTHLGVDSGSSRPSSLTL